MLIIIMTSLKNNDKTIVKEPTSRLQFRTVEDPSKDPHAYLIMQQKKSSIIDEESQLLTSRMNSKNKMQVKLNNDFNPNSFDLSYAAFEYNTPNKEVNNYSIPDIGAGRGFGNLDISNDIRNSSASREYTKEYRENKESQTLFDFQFNYLDKNFQDPNHIVLPFPRGGETTRKQNQLEVNNMRQNPESLNTIQFKY